MLKRSNVETDDSNIVWILFIDLYSSCGVRQSEHDKAKERVALNIMTLVCHSTDKASPRRSPRKRTQKRSAGSDEWGNSVSLWLLAVWCMLLSSLTNVQHAYGLVNTHIHLYQYGHVFKKITNKPKKSLTTMKSYSSHTNSVIIFLFFLLFGLFGDLSHFWFVIFAF